MPQRVVVVWKKPKRVVAVSLVPQRVVVGFFSLNEHFRSLSVNKSIKEKWNTTDHFSVSGKSIS